MATASPNLSCPAQTIISGDARSSINAAASIIAKVTRAPIRWRSTGNFRATALPATMAMAAAFHKAALLELGPCIHHRQSFAPIAKLPSPLTTISESIHADSAKIHDGNLNHVCWRWIPSSSMGFETKPDIRPLHNRVVGGRLPCRIEEDPSGSIDLVFADPPYNRNWAET